MARHRWRSSFNNECLLQEYRPHYRSSPRRRRWIRRPGNLG